MQHIVIVGTGLIGSSFGLALRKAGFTGAITGVSSLPAITDAIAAGAIDRGATLASAVPEADLVFLSQTIGRILDTIRPPRPAAPPRHAGHRRRQHEMRHRRSRASDLAARPISGRASHGR
jgi:prephenate dehydrogenase